MQVLKWVGVELVEVSYKEKIVSAIGAACAIFLVFAITQSLLPTNSAVGVIASMGASAVLLFAVPHGQLSQPWPVLGGHTISAFVGVVCCNTINNPVLATAIAVGASIGLMQTFKCIHPPGGATAFTAVMGGQAIHDLGFLYVLVPVGLNALAMLSLAIAINYPFVWRRYPAAFVKRNSDTANGAHVISADEHKKFIEAVRSLDSFVDVSEDDLIYLARTMAQFRQEHGEFSLKDLTETGTVRPQSTENPWLIQSDEQNSPSPKSMIHRGASETL